MGDCWFVGALSVLANRDELLIGAAASSGHDKAMLVDGVKANFFSMGVYPALFHEFRNKGIYVFRFFKEFKWRYVIVDERFPVYEGNKELLFGSCKNPSELWVPLIEKAYAKLFGCY